MMSSSGERLACAGFEVEQGIIVAGNGTGLNYLLLAAEQWLEAHVEVVNRLNVFPVPDGDTGTNMLLTMRSALAHVDQAPNQAVGTVAAAAAHGALMGARGNSGVILSQFFQGIAQRLAGQVSLTAKDWAGACQVGVDWAYQSVASPVEGTILTVARAAAEAAARYVEKNDLDLGRLLREMVTAAKIAQANTPHLLPVLKEVGVTDAGGQGLVYILEGGLRFLSDEPVALDLVVNDQTGGPPTLAMAEENLGYDVQFLIQRQGLQAEEIRTHIDRMGWSTVVVGEGDLVRVHLHTHDPGEPLSYGASRGLISDVVIENLTEQARGFVNDQSILNPAQVPTAAGSRSIATVSNQPATNVGLVAVVPGNGLAQIFKSLGVSQIVLGGQRTNPSPQELFDAVGQVSAGNVLILPNNQNVIPAAGQVQKLSDKIVKVVLTETVPQGIAALLAFNNQADVETNHRSMSEAARNVQTIEVTRAGRDSSVNGFEIKIGDVIGLLDNELVSVKPDYDETVLDIAAKIDIETYDIFTIYFGRECSSAQAEALAKKVSRLYPELEIELYRGGQPHYQYIISLE